LIRYGSKDKVEKGWFKLQRYVAIFSSDLILQGSIFQSQRVGAASEIKPNTVSDTTVKDKDL